MRVRSEHIQMARLGQAMASPVRLRALNLLAQRPWRVGELAEELGESLAATSAHLKVLRAACMVTDEKRGREVWCRVASDEVFRLLAAAQQAAQAILPELRERARQDDDPCLVSISPPALADEIACGRVTLVDLRPPDEYRAGHLPSARSLPYVEVDGWDVRSLRRQRKVIAYCRGPWCRMAQQGAAALQARKIPANRLAAGVVEWQAHGLPLEVSHSS